MTQPADCTPDEGRLVEAFRRERTASSFEELLRLHVERVRGVLLNLVMNSEDAEDLAQETWVTAFEQFDRFSGRSTFSTWVCGIAVKKGLHFLRTQKRRTVLMEEQGLGVADRPASASPEEALLREEQQQAVTRALAQLPDKLRAVITLSAIEEMTPAEIAQACGCTVPIVYWRLHAARKRLSQLLNRKESRETRN